MVASDFGAKSKKLPSTRSAFTTIGGQAAVGQAPCTVTRTPAWKVSPTRANLGRDAVRERVRRTMIFDSAAPNMSDGVTARARMLKVPRFCGAVKVAVPY